MPRLFSAIVQWRPAWAIRNTVTKQQQTKIPKQNPKSQVLRTRHFEEEDEKVAGYAGDLSCKDTLYLDVRK